MGAGAQTAQSGSLSLQASQEYEEQDARVLDKISSIDINNISGFFLILSYLLRDFVDFSIGISQQDHGESVITLGFVFFIRKIAYRFSIFGFLLYKDQRVVYASERSVGRVVSHDVTVCVGVSNK